MLYLYLDESGDLGFDFVNKKPSRYFTVTVLALRTVENNKKLAKTVKITLKRKFRENLTAELKGSACPLNIKKYFYTLARDIKFGIYSITLDKQRTYEHLSKDKERVYNYIARLVFDQIPFDQTDVRIAIIIDKSKTSDNIKKFDEYIIRQIKSKFDPRIPLDIYHYSSYECLCLQAVDMFGWGIFRKYERNDLEWYNAFKEKIQYEVQYLLK
ncbi:DUF3800 domain-containing protein [bacterium]|nr:DUF3800 domain-containing protein [bacterium]MBU1753462.1 DUF3800 domain-containing protein [bacterium]